VLKKLGPATWSPAIFSRRERQETWLTRGWPCSALVTAIYGGTSEIMKTIIARDITGLRT
jgi:alkylation response protein AidB-like acyl-CoA dehydrogenase